MKAIKRFWISWVQLTSDFRPLTDPPTEEVLGWWKSGEVALEGWDEIHLGAATLCAVVECKSERDAEKIILQNWAAKESEIGEFRFCEEKAGDWGPGNRFPITHDWEEKRFGLTEKQ